MTVEAGPLRMCVVCRRRFFKPELLRHVMAGAGCAEGNGLEADEAGVKPGRGWYVCRDPQCESRLKKMKFRRKTRNGSTIHG
ncbi:MAG: DUF448 domain-containing protein [Mailhella sp.]|nr:DUF448 domain-containing protein [Mailhella sp.]